MPFRTQAQQPGAAEIRILIAILDGLELQWLLGLDIDLRGLVETHVEQAIARWQKR